LVVVSARGPRLMLRQAIVIVCAAFCAVHVSQATERASGPVTGGLAAPVGGDTRSTALIQLGRMLFEDERLSADGTVSCAKCHIPKQAFADGRQRAVGVRGQAGTRNTPSLLNIADEKELFWDGRVTGLEEQVRSPLFNPREHALANDGQIELILGSIPEYGTRFRQVFGPGDAISITHVTTAIAAYERTLLTTASPFDRYWYGHHREAISASAQRGLELFRTRAGCAGCHVIGATSASFSDHQFHASSIGLDPSVSGDLPELTAKVVALHTRDGIVQLNDLIASDRRIAELGRFVATFDPADIGKFRTPSLRNVTLTAPYMHDGSVESLGAAVDLELYSRGAGGAKPIVLTADERTDLIEFLGSLSSAN
jgi:cytochrome c peroxidase